MAAVGLERDLHGSATELPRCASRAAPAGKPTPVDRFDAQGRRTGSAVVDRESGRVDFYDAMSRRTAFGRVDSPGKAERFGLDGMRKGETAVPIAPKAGAPR